LHTCRMNPAFHADAASCIGGSVRVRPQPAKKLMGTAESHRQLDSFRPSAFVAHHGATSARRRQAEHYTGGRASPHAEVWPGAVQRRLIGKSGIGGLARVMLGPMANQCLHPF
jgi:hypothetical protein